ncbi:MAG: SGNH/GDSL hydrolase family protein [Clostridia bacterium]|nr:SGNH/GDSL hydrolase family protein [Clostridia bacterium]
MTAEQLFTGTPLAPLTRGTLVEDETAAFIYPDEEKQLLYRIDRILAVKSYGGETVYEQGKDYVLRDGKLALTEHTRIPVMTPELYYSEGSMPILRVRKPDGTESPCYFSEDGTISRFQVRVTYTHTDAWDGFRQPCAGRFGRFLHMLEAGRDATVLFYGDSITCGANASLLQDTPPYQPPYPMLLTRALAELYGYAVRFAPPEAEKAYAKPMPDYSAGDRGALTYVNTAVGGWNSRDGVDRLGTHITPQVEKYGCDLFVLAFGMNDGDSDPQETADNCEKIVRHVLSMRKDASVLLVSTMLPNSDALGGWNASQPGQEAALLRLAEKLNGEGIPCGVAQMTSVSASVLTKKRFIDYTGNNINHPNDFFSRVYAQTLLQALVGYGSEIGRY